MGWFVGTWALRTRHPANLGPHVEPLETCVGVKEPPFDAQGPASIPGVGPTQPPLVLRVNVVHSMK
jgi:hypothetical protein